MKQELDNLFKLAIERYCSQSHTPFTMDAYHQKHALEIVVGAYISVEDFTRLMIDAGYRKNGKEHFYCRMSDAQEIPPFWRGLGNMKE